MEVLATLAKNSKPSSALWLLNTGSCGHQTHTHRVLPVKLQRDQSIASEKLQFFSENYQHKLCPLTQLMKTTHGITWMLWIFTDTPPRVVELKGRMGAGLVQW